MTDEEREQINRSDLEKINAAADYLKAEAEDLDQYGTDPFEEVELGDELLDMVKTRTVVIPRTVGRGEQMQKAGLPWHEAVANVAPKPLSLEEVKAWRTREAAERRPSSYVDFCRAHGLCLVCRGEGLTYNDNGVGFKVVGIDGDTRLFERCPVCGGTGVAPKS